MSFPKLLKRLANKAADLQTKWHNGEVEDSIVDKAIISFNIAAIKSGYKARWPGLYPVLIDKNNNTIYME